MSMTPRIRKAALTAHVTASVGWLGAVAAFLALAIAGLTDHRPQAVGGAYTAMQITGWYVIVPLSIACLATGIGQSLGTPWGLLRHYWVLIKLVITLLATALLLIHMSVVDTVADATANGSLSGGDLHAMRVQLVVDASAALVALLVTVSLSVAKPRGMTNRGRRAIRTDAPARPGPGATRGPGAAVTG